MIHLNWLHLQRPFQIQSLSELLGGGTFLLDTIQPLPSCPALYLVPCITSGFPVSFFFFFACSLLPNPAQNVLLPTSTTFMLCGSQFISLSILRIFKISVYLFGCVGSLLHQAGSFIIVHGLSNYGSRAPSLWRVGLVAPRRMGV